MKKMLAFVTSSYNLSGMQPECKTVNVIQKICDFCIDKFCTIQNFIYVFALEIHILNNKISVIFKSFKNF